MFCKVLNKELSYEEVKGRKIGDYVLETNGFKWNIHDVCLNPNVPVRIEIEGGRVEVSTAQSGNGRWSSGISMMLQTSGVGWGCHYMTGDDGEETEREAVIKGLRTVLERVKSERGRVSVKMEELVTEMLNEYIYPQLSLF